MKRKLGILLFVFMIGLLVACGNEDKKEENDQASQELVPLEVDFIVPEKADVGEKVLLKAVVTYGEEKVKDADDVKFEYWESGNQEKSTEIEANNNEDGTYTAEVTFDQDGVYEMYAHTTAKDMHTMPKTSITIGKGASATPEEDHHEHSEGHEHGHDQGLSMHFMKPEDINANQEINLSVHLQLHNEPLTNARVRYEIKKEGIEKHDWADTTETNPGEYSSSYSFLEGGKYSVIIHVEDDKGLHEHKEYSVEVSK